METTSNLKHRPFREELLNKTSISKQSAASQFQNTKETAHLKRLSK
jgi:hypothetical protein